MIDDLIKRTRSVRRFDARVGMNRATLVELVDLARHSASARNQQSLRFILSCEAEANGKVFSTLKFAAALKDWQGPTEAERPTAYIVVLAVAPASPYIGYDAGIACQNIMLGARDRGLGGCMIGSVDRTRLRELLAIPDRFEILLVLALGKPAETVVIEPLPPDGNVDYWRDSAGVHHVPKRSIDELILDVG